MLRTKVWFWAGLFTFLIGLCLASGKLAIYWNNLPVEIKTLEKNGELYISLADLAKYFPGTILFDLGKNRLDFSIAKTEKASPLLWTEEKAEAAKTAEIWGKAFITAKDLEIPLNGLSVAVRKTRQDLTEHMIQGLYYTTVANGGGEYLDLYPVAKSAISDESGVFVIKDIPPGNYELTASYKAKKILYGWRLLLKLKKGDSLKFELSDKNAVVKEDARR